MQAARCNILESRGVLVNVIVTGARQREEGRIDIMGERKEKKERKKNKTKKPNNNIKFFYSKDTNIRKLLMLGF